MSQSLLILPFQNLSTDLSDNYLADGITEELITILAQIPELNVASRTSSFFFKNKNPDLASIQERIPVTHILEGSIQRFENLIRVNIHLIKADGFTIWSKKMEIPDSNILAIQDQIGLEIRNQFTNKKEKAQLPMHSVPNQDSAAYNDYLKGLYYYNQYSMEMQQKACLWFKRAIEKQNDFALAYAYLSISYLALAGYQDPKLYKSAKKEALKALHLDDQLIEAYISLAFVQMMSERDWKAADLTLKKAMQINPRFSLVHRTRGVYNICIGQIEKAIEAHELATKFDPLSTIYINGLGLMLSMAGRFEEAKNEFEKALQLDSSFRPALEGLGWIKVYQQDWKAAASYFNAYRELVGHPLKGWLGMGYLYGRTGQLEKAYHIIELLDERGRLFPIDILDLDYALVYLGLSQYDKTFYYLNRALKNRHILTTAFLLTDPIYDPLRSDPRFEDLLKQLHLKDLNKNVQPLDQVNIHFQSQTKEEKDILLKDLVYIFSEGNYVRIVGLENGKREESFLRLSLGAALEQAGRDRLFHIHRSYLVNLSHFKKTQRSGRQLFLAHPELDLQIPVSRTKEKSLLQALKDKPEE